MMNKKLDRAYLGRGWSFPPTFDKQKKTVLLVQEEEDVAQSLHILLSTRPGERVMQSNYGCNLDLMLFETLTTSLLTQMKDIVNTAILFHEPRIDVNRINFNVQEVNQGVILIEVDYTIRNTNSRFNFVYPFYLEEGAKLNF